MQILVKTLTGHTLTLEAESNDLVIDLKFKLYDITEVPPENQRLVFAGCNLEDNRTIAESKVKKDSTLYMILRKRGGAIMLPSFDKTHAKEYSFNFKTKQVISRGLSFVFKRCPNSSCETSDENIVFCEGYQEKYVVAAKLPLKQCPKCQTRLFDKNASYLKSIVFHYCAAKITGTQVVNETVEDKSVEHKTADLNKYLEFSMEDDRELWQNCIIKTAKLIGQPEQTNETASSSWSCSLQ